MSQLGIYQALSQLLTVLSRSLSAYLANTNPWVRSGDEPAMAKVQHIADDHQRMADRVAAYISDNYGPPDVGEFPIDYFDTHDLALDFLVRKLVVGQKRDIQTIERLQPRLAGDRQAVALADEALGAERGHLETLEELSGQMTKSPV